MPTSHSALRSHVVVYDGNCGVCTRLAHALARWDVQQVLEVTTSQAPGVHARFPWIPEHAYAEALQLIAVDGTTWQGAAAIEQLITILPRSRWLAWIYEIPFARALADRFYRTFARNRYRFGCGDHCQVGGN